MKINKRKIEGLDHFVDSLYSAVTQPSFKRGGSPVVNVRAGISFAGRASGSDSYKIDCYFDEAIGGKDNQIRERVVYEETILHLHDAGRFDEGEIVSNFLKYVEEKVKRKSEQDIIKTAIEGNTLGVGLTFRKGW